jgi:D-hydroxyproline dehydrogenase subunit gamma
MFRRLHEPPATVTLFLDDVPLTAAAGETVAAALLTAGVTVFRAAPRRGNPRGPYCMIGNCYDCLAEIDGLPYRQACLTTVAEGMRIHLMTEHEAPT